MPANLRSLFILFLIPFGSFAADSTKVSLKSYAPEEQHPAVFQTTLQFISGYHYNKLKIDDAFSSKAFDNYVEHLDPGKVYLLQSDVNDFESFRQGIDDAVMGGSIQPAFEMYNRYQQRLKERIEFAIETLKNDFDYTGDETYIANREKAARCNSVDEMNLLWKKKLKYECLTLRATGKDAKFYLETVSKRYQNLLRIISKTKPEDVFSLFLNSVTELADPHTNYFSPRMAEDFRQSMSLSLEGIGAQLQTENEYTKVTMIIKGGPADKSKLLHANDRIIGVSQGRDSDMVNVIDWRLDDVVSLIRGKKGTLVRLEIIPATDPNKTTVIELIRDKIVLEDQSAKSSLKLVKRDGVTLKIGVVSLPAFYIDFAAQGRGEADYKSTTRDVRKLIEDLKKQEIDGLVIDLRNNGGGSLQEAVDLTGLFIKSGAVVQVRDANGNIKSEMDHNSGIVYDGPLTVLVNRFSASASEIFAAAIQDYQRGVVIGEKTFGKGTVQNMVELDHFMQVPGKKLGQVKLTIAKFYRVTGSSTQHKGVTPDIELPGVFDGDQYGEDASEFALPWDQISATTFNPLPSLDGARNILRSKHSQRMGNSAEYRYLMEDIAYVKMAREKNEIPLNEVKFKAENEAREKQKKDREAARAEAKKTDADAGDLLLNEGEQVLADLLKVDRPTRAK
jgi:carboxyl-terminal processing protease